MGKIIDETGKRYGKLVVLKYAGMRGAVATWLCRCDCGNEKIIDGNNLRKKHTRSCGCLHGRRPMPDGEASFNEFFSQCKRGAKRRGIAWELSKEQVREIAVRDCFYCGRKPEQFRRRSDLNGIFTYNGIDRIDNSKGYVVGNVVSCCKRCNYAKRDMTADEFRHWVNTVYEHWSSK